MNYASKEYFLLVTGLVFLRHAYSPYLSVKPEIKATLPASGGKRQPLTKEDFSQENANFLRPDARSDHFVSPSDSADLVSAIIGAMEATEKDCESLREMLPENEYRVRSNDVHAQPLHAQAYILDSRRTVVQVKRGKGRCDYDVMLSLRLLEILPSYWGRTRPQTSSYSRGRCPAAMSADTPLSRPARRPAPCPASSSR